MALACRYRGSGGACPGAGVPETQREGVDWRTRGAGPTGLSCGARRAGTHRGTVVPPVSSCLGRAAGCGSGWARVALLPRTRGARQARPLRGADSAETAAGGPAGGANDGSADLHPREAQDQSPAARSPSILGRSYPRPPGPSICTNVKPCAILAPGGRRPTRPARPLAPRAPRRSRRHRPPRSPPPPNARSGSPDPPIRRHDAALGGGAALVNARPAAPPGRRHRTAAAPSPNRGDGIRRNVAVHSPRRRSWPMCSAGGPGRPDPPRGWGGEPAAPATGSAGAARTIPRSMTSP
jgi:hypothetical protein